MAFDSTPDALAVQRDVWRRLEPAGRVRVAIQMSEAARRVTLAGIVARDPALSPGEAQRLLVLRLYGVDVAAPGPAA